MRVISGIAGGHRLVAPKGYDTRPTSDKIKQSLFSMIASDLVGCAFLDLFAGTGAIGIEALSRGAEKCAFVEKNKEAMECIKKNTMHTKFTEKSSFYMSDARNALNIIAKKGEIYNIIFMDPPYEHSDQMAELIDIIKKENLLAPNGYIIGEHGMDFDIDIKNARCIKQRKYGKTTAISFWEI